MTPIAEKSIGPDGTAFAERRGGTRRRVLKGAVLSFNRGFSTFECIVRNVSAGGARLSMGETFALPSEFLLTLDGNEPQRAKIRWRAATTLGVEFAKAAEA